MDNEKLVSDIAADISENISLLSGVAYTPYQWMGTARNAVKHFEYHKPNLRQLIEGCREKVSEAIFNSSKSYIASEKDCLKAAQAAISAIVEKLKL